MQNQRRYRGRGQGQGKVMNLCRCRNRVRATVRVRARCADALVGSPRVGHSSDFLRILGTEYGVCVVGATQDAIKAGKARLVASGDGV